MSNKQQFNARVRHKTGKYADWEQAANSFKPLLGEIIVYIPDDANDTRPTRLKVGDGEKFINELDFITNPEGGGNAPGGSSDPQIQTDYSQNDPVAIDYIKNRPFYSLPPEHSFDLGLNRSFEECIWDGDITNRKKVYLDYEGIEVEWYKVSDNFYTRDQILNGYAYVNLYNPDELSTMAGNTTLSYLIPIPLSDSVLTNIVLYSDEHYLIGLGAVSTDTPGILPLPDENGGTIEIDIPEPGTYYLYDRTGAMFGIPGSYTKQIVGAVDVLNDPDFMIADAIYGTGTYLAFKKVSDLFFDRNSLLDTVFTVNMISWNPSNMFDGMSVQMKIDQSSINSFTSINSSTDSSYALTADGIPIFASFETDAGEIDGMTPGKGTYLLYSDLNSANNGDVIFTSGFNTGETIQTIDPKYIPKSQRLSPDWDESDPKSNLYIKNKPFYINDIYLNNLNYPTESEVKVEIDKNPNNYFGLIYSGRLPIRLSGSVSTKITSPYIYFNGDGTTTYLSDITSYYYDDSGAKFTIYSLKDGQVVNNSTTIAIYVPTPMFEYFYIDGTYYEEFFPEAGLYYLQHGDLGFTMRRANSLYYYWNDYDYQPNWSETDSSRPGYIQNKPNISTTSSVTQYSSSLVTSGAVYNALQNIEIDVDDTITSNSNNPVSSSAIYNALQNVKVTTDSSISSTSTNPIQSKAIFSALGNRTSLTFDSTPQSGSNNPITSGAVYTALGGSSISTTSNVQSNSSSLMTSKGVYTALGNRTSLTFDDTPTSGSSDLMTSGAIYNALLNVEVDVEDEVTSDSENAVSSAAVYAAIENAKIIPDTEIIAESTNAVSGGAVYTALENLSINEAERISGYKFRVDTKAPTSEEVDDYTFTFVI